MGLEQVLRALPAETMVDGLPRAASFGWFLIDNFGLINSFGPALFVEQDMVSLHGWELVRSPGKSICQRLSGDKVMVIVKIVKIL